PSMQLSQTECLVPREDLDWYYCTYYGGSRSRENPDVSPLFAPSLERLPPALIITAEYDTLRDEGKAYADRLREANVRVQYSCYPGMVHGFLQMRGLVTDARAALDEIAGVVSPRA
ncbi:MAG TPA: alpha/beta hydrolase fold domain-containing protein, partial [Casimicrobiaceae bacterium]|nr:alpha/beta hydrolase fold domain-containing protein [Casimicrobiaceae bacterium]